MQSNASHYRAMPDDRLIQRIVHRDIQAYEVLYDRHAQIVYNVIVRIVRHHPIADELLQETFWRVWERADQYNRSGSVSAWLYRVARNLSLDHLRRTRRQPDHHHPDAPALQLSELADVLPAGEGTLEAAVEQAEDRHHIRAALAAIPAEQRICLELAYFEGMSQREIAEAIDVPLGTIKTRMRMGMEKLERHLRAAGFP